ncbi:MAG: hypothetical protein K2L05_00675 [Muribaculaceae bacterium]|nr:hypothetical protein [Muribaculaceae bacterium]
MNTKFLRLLTSAFVLVINLIGYAEVPEILNGFQDMNYGYGKCGYIMLPTTDIAKDNLVDVFLAESTPLDKITLADSGIEGNIMYIKTIISGKPQQKYGWQGYVFRIENYKGKEIKYQVYDNPDVYYAIIDFPMGRYYGFYTTGYKGGHPFNGARLLSGTLVDSTGVCQDVTGCLPSQLESSNWNPVGKYYANDELWGYHNMQLIFNQDRTGKLIFKKTSRHQAVQYWKGSATRRKSNGQKEKIRSLTGGYHFYIHNTISVPIKWSKEDENIKVIYSAKPIINIKGEVDGDNEFNNMSITEADKRIQRQVHRNDLPQNEDYLKQKKVIENVGIRNFPVGDGFDIKVHARHKGMIILNINKDSKRYYFPISSVALDLSNKEYYSLLSKIPNIKNLYTTVRENGAKNYIPILIQRLKNAIRYTDISLLKNCHDFALYNVNMANMHCSIKFITEGHLYTSSLILNKDDLIDEAHFNENLLENKQYSQVSEQIKKNDEFIKSYSKDKRRSKIVKEYNSKMKTYRKILDSPTNDFGALSRLESCQKSILQLQDSYLKLLQ